MVEQSSSATESPAISRLLRFSLAAQGLRETNRLERCTARQSPPKVHKAGNRLVCTSLLMSWSAYRLLERWNQEECTQLYLGDMEDYAAQLSEMLVSHRHNVGRCHY